MRKNTIVPLSTRPCRWLHFGVLRPKRLGDTAAAAWLVALFAVPCAGHADALRNNFSWRLDALAKQAAGRDALAHNPAGAPHAAHTGRIVSFDAPGAGTAAGQGTVPLAINASGVIAGYFFDSNNAAHGFVRSHDGNMTVFDPPGSAGTYATAINPAGTIVGYANDANGVEGYLRSSNGTFTILAGRHGVALTPFGINRAGVVTGWYSDANATYHGFRRRNNGAFTGFEAPGAGTFGFAGTQAFAINRVGTIVGSYYDLDFNQYDFLRTRKGVFTNVTALPGPLRPPEFAPVAPFSPGVSVNEAGAVAGSYVQPLQNNPYGYNVWVYIRDPHGAVTTFAAADYSPCCIWSWATGINDAGSVTGYFNDGYNSDHGFVRTTDGAIDTFDAPNAGPTGTAPAAINAHGTVTGPYVDADHVIHGFLRLP